MGKILIDSMGYPCLCDFGQTQIQPEEDLLIPEEVNEPIIDAQELPRKQNFFGNLEMVLNEDNYDSIPNQNRKKYAYKDSKNTVNITWSTVKEDNSLAHHLHAYPDTSTAALPVPPD